MSGKRPARGTFTRKVRNPSAVSAPAQDFVLAAVIEDPATPEVFTLAAYRPDDTHLASRHFPGREVREVLDRAFLGEQNEAEVRQRLRLANKGANPDCVIIGDTDGKGGWASWNLGLSGSMPGPVPDLSEPGQ